MAWSFVLIPDTQYLCTPANGWTGHLANLRDWVTNNVATHDIEFIGGLGDIVDLGHDIASWDNAGTYLLPLLDLGMPALLLTAGNHDSDQTGNQPARDFDNFNAYFGPSVYAGKAWFGGLFEAGKAQNAYATFTADGQDYLAFMVEFFPRPAVLDWVESVAATMPNHRVIVLTHAFLEQSGVRSSWASSNYGPSHYWSGGQAANPDVLAGQEMWDYNLKDIPNLWAVFNGHYADNVAYRIDLGSNGNKVLQGFYNWQFTAEGGKGRVVLMTVDETAGTIHQRVVRTDLDTFETGTSQAFAYDTTHDMNPAAPVPLNPGTYAVSIGGVMHSVGNSVVQIA